MKVKYILIFLCFLLLSYKAFALEIIPLRQLFEQAPNYDGKNVTVKGEAVGDIMGNGETFWVNIRDGDFFIGVVLDSEKRSIIKNLGRYRVKGDIVKVTGTYKVQCPQHYGDRDIHAETLEIIEEGRRLEETVETDKIVLSIALGFAAILFIFYSHHRKFRKDSGDQQN